MAAYNSGSLATGPAPWPITAAKAATGLRNLQKTMDIYFHTNVTIGISQLFDGYKNLRTMYQQCSFCLDRKFFHGTGELLFFSVLQKDDECLRVRKIMERFTKEPGIDERTYTMLHTGIELFEKEPSQEVLINFFKNCVNREIGLIVMENQKQFTLSGEYIQKMDQAETLEQLLNIYWDLRHRLFENPEAGNVNRIVTTILQYIEKNYSCDITLEQIAEIVELSPGYVCSQFKKEMGVNLFRYLKEFRVERAKELLLNTNMKSYEIAEKTGFADESYFSRSFKRITGLSPVEFRNSVFHEK